jgi:hypothetical protein
MLTELLAIHNRGKNLQRFPRTSMPQDSDLNATNLLVVDEKVRRERRWTSAGATPARELVRSTR